jgi:plasmid stabilization system protein ParE
MTKYDGLTDACGARFLSGIRYRICYRLVAGDVIVLHIRHTARPESRAAKP